MIKVTSFNFSLPLSLQYQFKQQTKNITMKKNIGSIEKIIRIVIAVVALGANFLIPLTGTMSYVAIGVGALALLTGLINFCPLWAVIGVNTDKK